MLVTDSIIITPLTTTGTLTVYVDLKRVYQNPLTTWFPELQAHQAAVTKEKGIRIDAQECSIEPL